MKTLPIQWLKISVSSELPLLSDFYRKQLNPLQINLVSCKDIPFKTEPKYKPIFASCDFIDGGQFKTLEMPQMPACRFMHRHVFLVGLHDPVQFKEMLATKLVRVYLHDCDEYVSEDSEANFSLGQASYTFKDFLRPFCHELKLRSDIFPMKRAEIDNTQNLDLNTTARKNEKTVEKFSPYLINATYCVMQANLAHPIGSFNLEREMAQLNAKDDAVKEEEKVDDAKSTKSKSEQRRGSQGSISSALVADGPAKIEDVNGAIY